MPIGTEMGHFLDALPVLVPAWLLPSAGCQPGTNRTLGNDNIMEVIGRGMLFVWGALSTSKQEKKKTYRF